MDLIHSGIIVFIKVHRDKYDLETKIPLMYKYWIAEASEQEIYEDAVINHDFPKAHAINLVQQIKDTDIDSFIRESGSVWDAYVHEIE